MRKRGHRQGLFLKCLVAGSLHLFPEVLPKSCPADQEGSRSPRSSLHTPHIMLLISEVWLSTWGSVFKRNQRNLVCATVWPAALGLAGPVQLGQSPVWALPTSESEQRSSPQLSQPLQLRPVGPSQPGRPLAESARA